MDRMHAMIPKGTLLLLLLLLVGAGVGVGVGGGGGEGVTDRPGLCLRTLVVCVLCLIVCLLRIRFCTVTLPALLRIIGTTTGCQKQRLLAFVFSVFRQPLNLLRKWVRDKGRRARKPKRSPRRSHRGRTQAEDPKEPA